VVLDRAVDDDVWRLAQGLGTVLADLPCEAARTVAWPLPGGPAAWDDLAARAMFECPRD
jgi:hypothetical protein